MDRISTTTKAVDLFGAGKHGFKDGNLGLGIAPTDFNAAWFNDIQEELIGIIESAGLTPTAGTRTQVAQAVQALIADVGRKGIQSITSSVAANALTLGMNPTTLDFRSSSLTNGVPNTRSNGAAISLVVPAGATLGTISAQAARLVLIAIDNAGTMELAVVNLAGGVNLDETTLISTTAISAAATSASVVYSTTARTNVPFRVVGFLDITETTAGTWATDATTKQGIGGEATANKKQYPVGNAPVFAARAWCVFDGTVTGTNAPIAGGNVTSITRSGLGTYTINLTTAMPDVNFACVVNAAKRTSGSANGGVRAYQISTSTIQVVTCDGGTGTIEDNPSITFALFR